ncbi:MAG: DmsE family decaheme c-type cytochrome [Nitrospinae bacterium]|nr:DmsE family decaheme c-type cytochrome [Nitrospinota bacterium]
MKNLLFFLVFIPVFFFEIPHRDAYGDEEYTGIDICKRCHETSYESYSKSIHGKKVVPHNPANEKGCETCHGPGADHVEKVADEKIGEIRNFGKKESAEDKSAVCLNCHTISKKLAFWDMGQHKKNDVACTSCHSIHNGERVKQVEQCFNCHRDIKSETNKQSHHPIKEGKVKCADCHNPHGTLSHGMIVAENVNQLCYKCHADKRGPFVWEHPPVEENCLICHSPHGSKTAKMMKEKIPNICEDCHDWSRHPGTIYDTRAGFTGSSPSNRFLARSCVNCHSAIHGSYAPVNPSSGSNSGKFFVR